MCDHGSIGPFMGVLFLEENLALSVLAFSFSIFVHCGVKKSPVHKILAGNQRERTTLSCGFLSFLIATIMYCSNIV